MEYKYNIKNVLLAKLINKFVLANSILLGQVEHNRIISPGGQSRGHGTELSTLFNDRFSSSFSGITCERTTKDFLMMLIIFCLFMIQYST